MNRNVIVYDGNEIIQQYQEDVDWETVRAERDSMLETTDMWMLTDRYNTLTESQQTELTNYRQTLRDLPSVYFDETDFDEQTGLGTKGANEAADNFPTPPDWL